MVICRCSVLVTRGSKAIVVHDVGVVHDVEDAGVVVIKCDIDMQDDHRFVELDEWLRYKVSDALFAGLEGTLVAVDLLDDLEVDLEFDEGDRGRFNDPATLDEAF